ncbi:MULTISPECIES: D-inositol-3-phosphate glycosyltransferase [Streptomyces]|uniref:D-inositol-3-phosphate glycosyltransferase n=2 Tax=Streptomyces rimosus subsp. rimosus TaxID=132474 RepID=L8EV85_STRR1|nr:MULTISPECIES: D-inositol-3-phosphate glycosyltransferase [Streptomyces]KOG75278.1 D-inositol 3-phosphate glycosyltransferase [Kitasatospora aureofaciens]MYT45880.1 D-inositol-3-phosphate glycosyltransferase [Streptomyces sp. SID5471]KEF05388.1 D-inositol 3-phosphate glycosyltransferase [Streptomyces rimosus]KEF18830.1 D-inositol 3-phosphate glycosyltransferase [Streptomyces rimosus]KUJ28753.1 D-inositol-3-phosphate glycosyltransferase [Streptomyces rimosus subsp. rimosus]
MSQYVSRLRSRSHGPFPGRTGLRLPGAARRPRRVAMLSVHTSPLHQPGTGDAGGMNVYIVELARKLAALNIEVEIFTRATTGTLPPAVELAPGVLVRHVDAGPYEGLAKEELPAQLCAFTHGVMQAWAGHRPGYYDLVHSHYWLSGHVGWLAAERWGVPLVHAMHTMAKVKNAALAAGDTPEPAARVIGETQIVRAADRLIANTDEEAGELIRHYEAERGKVAVVHPGVNLDRFRPADESTPGEAASDTSGSRAAARARLGLPQDALIPLFAGRIQPLKAPDILLRAVAVLLDEEPSLRSRLVVPVVGGPSGSGLAKPEGLQKLAARLGIADVVRFRPPVGQEQLADWYRAASVLVMPSYSESFGLVAIEAQACGTPVIAAAVGGLPVAVRDGVSGFLIAGHDPADYARALGRFARDTSLAGRMGGAAARHARSFGWDTAAAATAEVYTAAMQERRRHLRSPHG